MDVSRSELPSADGAPQASEPSSDGLEPYSDLRLMRTGNNKTLLRPVKVQRYERKQRPP